MQTFMLPPDSGYSSLGFNLGKIGGSSTDPLDSASRFWVFIFGSMEEEEEEEEAVLVL